MTKKQILAAKIAEREAKEKAAQDKKAEIAELTPAQRNRIIHLPCIDSPRHTVY